MAIKHFDSEFFSEIIHGMSQTCEGLEVQQLLAAATQIYLANNDKEPIREGRWNELPGSDQAYSPRKIVECPFCKTKRAVFMCDVIDYCNGCGAKMVTK
jgi:hypothetical protein